MGPAALESWPCARISAQSSPASTRHSFRRSLIKPAGCSHQLLQPLTTMASKGTTLAVVLVLACLTGVLLTLHRYATQCQWARGKVISAPCIKS